MCTPGIHAAHFPIFLMAIPITSAQILASGQEDMERFKAADYVVIYIHQWQRDIPPLLLDYLRDKTPEKSFWIDGIEYARVYKLN